MQPRLSFVLLVSFTLVLSACGGPADPIGGTPNGDDPSIAEYVVGPGRVATVTSVSGVIDGYDGGAVDATFAGIGGVGTGCPIDDPECQPSFTPSRPWVPTAIDAQGAFTIALPSSPTLDDFGNAVFCGEEHPFSFTGVLYVHDEPFGQPGSSPTASYVRARFEDPKVPVGFLADAAALVTYAFTTSSVDLTCTQDDSGNGMGTLLLDIDLRLRPGWNVVTWVQRSEDDDMVLYLRTGEPGLSVPWDVPEQLY